VGRTLLGFSIGAGMLAYKIAKDNDLLSRRNRRKMRRAINNLF
jgi:hypothetical protein